jgi:hypothetical protein
VVLFWGCYGKRGIIQQIFLQFGFHKQNHSVNFLSFYNKKGFVLCFLSNMASRTGLARTTYSVRAGTEERRVVLKKLLLKRSKREVLTFLKRKFKTLKCEKSVQTVLRDIYWFTHLKMPKAQEAYNEIDPESVADDGDDNDVSSSSSSSSSDSDAESASSSDDDD